LEVSSYLVPVLIGMAGVLPAFGLGIRLGGELGGLCAALVAAVNPLFLSRSLGSDDDVWNLVLPLFLVWAAAEAIGASRPRRQIACALIAGLVAGLDAATWTGWTFVACMVLAALALNLGLELGRGAVERIRCRPWNGAALKRAGLVTAVFYLSAGLFATVAGDRG